MATLAEVIVTTLNDDATLSALLTGGVFNAEDFTFDGGGADEVPRQANGVLIKPFAIVRFKSADAYGPILVQGELQTVEIYVYDNVGFATIESALTRMKALLHHKTIDADDRTLAFFLFVYVSGEMDAPELGGVACKFIRFTNTQIRA